MLTAHKSTRPTRDSQQPAASVASQDDHAQRGPNLAWSAVSTRRPGGVRAGPPTRHAPHAGIGGPTIQRKCATCARGGARCPACKEGDTAVDTEGNPTWLRLAARVHRKLAIGAVDDPYEREADRVADQVSRMPDPQVQRQAEPAEEEEPVIQTSGLTSETSTVPSGVQRYIETLASKGQPMSDTVRQNFENRIGYQFGRVRIHSDGEANQSASALRAKAYTVGPHVVFGAGHYDPNSAQGQHLLAHELTHVVQQGAARPNAPGSHLPHSGYAPSIRRNADASTGVQEYPSNSPGGVIQLSRGTGETKNIRGIEFERDEDDNLIITHAIILKTMKDTYDQYLKSEDKWSGPEHVKEVMSDLDTIFYYISRDSLYKHKRFVVAGDPLGIEYTAEEVNYLGVGMGFNHFHIFGHVFVTAQAMVLAWNLTKYEHLASFGEHYWADFGFDMYYVYP